MDLPASAYHDSLEELWDEEEEPEEIETMINVVSFSYHQYLDVLSKVKEEKLPPHRACNNHIELEQSLPPVGLIYSLSNQDSNTLRAYISEILEKAFILQSSSSTGAPVLFAKTKDGGLRLCVDYRKLNGVTRKIKYLVPPMNQLLTVFNGSSIFPKIDLNGAYNLLRIKEGEENLTCFGTKYGRYEYLVMPFGITNAPASLKNLFNDIFYDLLDVSVVVYFDNIMVFSKSEEEHVTHVSTALSRLRANNLFAKASNCLSDVLSVEYLGYIFSSQKLKINQAKSSKFSIGLLQETSSIFNNSLDWTTFTALSSRNIQIKLVHSQVSSRKIPIFPSMRKHLYSLINSKTLSPLLQSFPTLVLLYPPF
ncbi:hypothetical protein O181_001072 [Austropuccinia psidii MF-1]|uniref:Reverse transcriptase domain-containing protein n=1 Tax=Austropuccinia psidii MF-1 TaxID=1389203 RepID=A0A9Q3BA40_9BASI|nr:hypothetical protein [Austropuccinia psidii MF-1]